MAADSLAPCVARTSAAMLLTGEIDTSWSYRPYSPSSLCSHISSYSITATTRLLSKAQASANTTGCGGNNRVDSRFVPSQWEMALLCNNVSHWLGSNLESALEWPDNTMAGTRLNVWTDTQEVEFFDRLKKKIQYLFNDISFLKIHYY